MAHFVLKDVTVRINGRNVSSDLDGIELNIETAGVQDVSGLDEDWTAFATEGRVTWNAVLTLLQDFVSGQNDDFFDPLVRDIVTFTCKPFAGGVTANNPERRGKGILLSYSPFSGSVGELATATVVIQGSGKLERAIS